jgi:hypothetical protein
MSPFTVILWDDDCEQHTVRVDACDPTAAAILARISQARMDDRPLVEVEAIAVIPGHGECFTDLIDANWYSAEGGDEGEDQA